MTEERVTAQKPPDALTLIERAELCRVCPLNIALDRLLEDLEALEPKKPWWRRRSK